MSLCVSNIPQIKPGITLCSDDNRLTVPTFMFLWNHSYREEASNPGFQTKRHVHLVKELFFCVLMNKFAFTFKSPGLFRALHNTCHATMACWQERFQHVADCRVGNGSAGLGLESDPLHWATSCGREQWRRHLGVVGGQFSFEDEWIWSKMLAVLPTWT